MSLHPHLGRLGWPVQAVEAQHGEALTILPFHSRNEDHEMRERMAADIKKWATVIEEAGIEKQ